MEKRLESKTQSRVEVVLADKWKVIPGDHVAAQWAAARETTPPLPTCKKARQEGERPPGKLVVKASLATPPPPWANAASSSGRERAHASACAAARAQPQDKPMVRKCMILLRGLCNLQTKTYLDKQAVDFTHAFDVEDGQLVSTCGTQSAHIRFLDVASAHLALEQAREVKAEGGLSLGTGPDSRTTPPQRQRTSMWVPCGRQLRLCAVRALIGETLPLEGVIDSMTSYCARQLMAVVAKPRQMEEWLAHASPRARATPSR